MGVESLLACCFHTPEGVRIIMQHVFTLRFDERCICMVDLRSSSIGAFWASILGAFRGSVFGAFWAPFWERFGAPFLERFGHPFWERFGAPFWSVLGIHFGTHSMPYMNTNHEMDTKLNH